MKLSVDSKFNWPFFVDTKERKFEFYAQSEIERNMWRSGFEYVLKLNTTSKDLILKN